MVNRCVVMEVGLLVVAGPPGGADLQLEFGLSHHPGFDALVRCKELPNLVHRSTYDGFGDHRIRSVERGGGEDASEQRDSHESFSLECRTSPSHPEATGRNSRAIDGPPHRTAQNCDKREPA